MSHDSDVKRKVFTCVNCLSMHYNQALLKQHQELCFKNESQTINMPNPGSAHAFSQFEARHKAALIGAFDFEVKLPSGNKIKTAHSESINEHKVVSYSFVIISSDDEIVFERSEQDEHNCLDLFMAAVIDAEKLVNDIMNRMQPMDITDEEQDSFDNAERCHICLLYTSPSPRDLSTSRMPSSA